MTCGMVLLLANTAAPKLTPKTRGELFAAYNWRLENTCAQRVVRKAADELLSDCHPDRLIRESLKLRPYRRHLNSIRQRDDVGHPVEMRDVGNRGLSTVFKGEIDGVRCDVQGANMIIFLLVLARLDSTVPET